MVLWKKPRICCQTHIQSLAQLRFSCVIWGDLTSPCSVSQLPQAAVTTYHSVGVFNNRHLLLTDLETGMFMIKMPANSVPGDRPFLVHREPSSCMLVELEGWGEGEREEESEESLVSSSFYKGTNRTVGAPPS